MNRYPFWKYIIILITLMVGVIYTLPNFFGEAPAVQVSAGKVTVRVDDGTLSRVEAALKTASLAPTRLTLEGNSVWARFDTTDNQLKVDIPADVSFDVGRYAIKPNMRPVLDRLASTLNQHPVTTVTIIGHTDSTGSDAVNDPLSVNRAASTRDYLVQRGVSAQRIAVDGRGSRQPVADNSTASGRAMNRRVEIFIAEPAR